MTIPPTERTAIAMNAVAHPLRHTRSSLRLNRWVVRLVLAVATAHMLVGAIDSSSHWSGIISDGVWNTVSNDDARMMAMWFMISGMALFGLGLLIRRAVIATGTVPPEAGGVLLAIGVPISLLEPVSGGWALIAIGALALVASRRRHPTASDDRA